MPNTKLLSTSCAAGSAPRCQRRRDLGQQHCVHRGARGRPASPSGATNSGRNTSSTVDEGTGSAIAQAPPHATRAAPLPRVRNRPMPRAPPAAHGAGELRLTSSSIMGCFQSSGGCARQSRARRCLTTEGGHAGHAAFAGVGVANADLVAHRRRWPGAARSSRGRGASPRRGRGTPRDRRCRAPLVEERGRAMLTAAVWRPSSPAQWIRRCASSVSASVRWPRSPAWSAAFAIRS